MSSAASAGSAATGRSTSVTPVVSTMAGTVVERQVAQGQVVQPVRRACSWWPICPQVWVTAEVPEQQAALVRPVRRWTSKCRPSARGSPASWFRGRHGQSGKPARSRCAAQVDNASRQLKPAMLATMLIQAAPGRPWWCRSVGGARRRRRHGVRRGRTAAFPPHAGAPGPRR